MRKAILLVFIATVVTMSAVADAQEVGYDPSKVLVTLVSVTADASGTAAADVTLPDQVTPGYEVIAAGVDPANVRRSVLAVVTGDESALATSAGSRQIVLISVSQTVDHFVHVEASGFKPFSTVTFSVRFTPAATTAGGGGGTLPFTGSNVGLLVAIALAALLLGGPLTLGSRLTSRFSRADAED